MATNTKEFRVKNGLEISSGPIKINGSSGSSGQVLSSTGSGVQWVAPTTGSGTGDVVGPASSTVNAVVRFDGTTGKLIKNSSGVTIDDSSNITTSGSLTVSGNATFDTNTLFVDATNDRVGIGTVSPSTKLEVVGGYSTFAGLRIGGTDTNVNQIWQSNSGTTLGITANGGAIVFGQTSSEQMRLTSGGSLGVGTSSPDGKLEVSGKLKVRGTTSANDLVQVWGVSGGSGSYSTLELIKTADTSGNFIFRGFTAGGTGTAPKIAFGNWSATPFDGAQMTLDTSSGNVGIGVVPSAWGGSFATTQYKGGFIGSQASGYLYTGQNTYYNGTDWKYINTAAVTMMEQSAGVFIFYRAASGTAGNNVSFSESMRITNGGSVGIGTSSPAQKLDINGKLRFTPNTADTNYSADIYANYDSAHPFQLDVKNNGSTAEYLGVYADGGGSNNRVVFPTGNVGIGITSPSAKLSIYKGSAGVLATLQGGGTACGFAQGVVGGANTFEIQTQDTTTGTLATRYLIRGGTDNANHEWYAGARGSETAKMFLDSTNGFLGIGTITPASRLMISGTGTGAWFTVNRTDSGTNIIDFTASGSRLGYVGYNGSDLYLNQASAANTIFFTNSTERMRLDASGNLGLGTSNPLARLDIVGDATPNGNGLAFGHANTAGYKWIQSFAGQSLYINPLGNNVIFNRDGGSVGIGTVSPAYKLDVNGTFNASGAITQSGNQVLHAGNYSSYALPLSGGVVTGSTYYRKNQTDGNYGTASLWTESYGNTTTGIAFHISGVVGKFLEMRTNGTLYFDNNTMIHSGNYSSYAVPTGDVSVSNVADKIVKRDGNGHIYVTYVFSSYLNQSGGNSENPTIGQIWTQNTTDNYCRKSTPAHFKAQMGMYHNDGTSTANRIIISTSTPTGTITNGDVWLQY